MAKQFNFGIEDIARNVRKAYWSVPSTDELYELQLGEEISITATNISQHFTVTNGSYYFAGSGNTFTTNNNGVKSSNASTTLTALKDMQVSFNYSYSSEAKYDKFYLTIAEEAIESAVSGATTNKSWSGIIKAGQAIVFTYTKDGSQDTNDDKCTFSGMVIAEVSWVPKEGVELKRIARNIRKAYYGDNNGIARLFFQSGSKARHKTTLALGYQRAGMATAPLKNYAVFAGGGDYEDAVPKTLYTNVFAYDTQMVRSMPTALSVARGEMFGAKAGSTAIFAGGVTTSGTVSTVDSYDENLTKGTLTSLRSTRGYGAAASLGKYALFAGGINSRWKHDESGCSNIVDAYDSSLTRIDTVSPLSEARSSIGVATVGKYAIFAGGLENSVYSYAIDVYDDSLTKTPGNRGIGARIYGIKGATAGDYAVFFGGSVDYETDNLSTEPSPFAYDQSLTCITLDHYFSDYPYQGDYSKQNHAGVSLGESAVFAGSYSTNFSQKYAVAFDSSLTVYEPGDLGTARGYIAACSVGNYAYFIGGRLASNASSQHIDVYELI